MPDTNTTPTATPDADPIEQLVRISRRLRHSNARALAPLGLSPHQARALRLVAREAPIRPSVLAECLHIVPRSATQVVDDLVNAGWVARSPDPDDRRATLLTLTEAGTEVARQSAEIRAAEQHRLLEPLTPEDRDRLKHLLDLIEARQTIDR
ncbi:MarR family transcriptional regulator [Brooklawnia cerclae]|uniref:DNA-binding MarR family transcriptional regulator n=1 Tax=Brooklawnia cerclae TaxID=349934 RepID=A0ABX0SLN8_9ACTN|nr:MarR family transcriptional regulator [Brooklawnia cerclae]NIH57637.1 DNA-binding MarR family transcriptional regulator [Brooklawnia cerclae]